MADSVITVNLLTEFVGWCLVINTGLLIFTSVALLLFKSHIVKIHRALMAIDEEQLSIQYFSYLAKFKIMVIVFNLTPYIALKLLS